MRLKFEYPMYYKTFELQFIMINYYYDYIFIHILYIGNLLLSS